MQFLIKTKTELLKTEVLPIELFGSGGLYGGNTQLIERCVGEKVCSQAQRQTFEEVTLYFYCKPQNGVIAVNGVMGQY
ncbi:hypothetical protein J7L05_01360 [bacterium]|nr:hypothetical protein [bacterium]